MFSKQIKSIRFLSSFIKDLGGFHVFIKKIFITLKKHGIKGAINKTRYIVFQSTINTHYHKNEKSNFITSNHLYQTLDCDLKKIKKHVKLLKTSPLFSVIMPTYNSNIKWLIEAIESVQNQIYPNWELCIADDASTDLNCIKTLKKYAEEDKRIRVSFRKENGHISAASNSALKMAKGDFIVLLDHDDLLSLDALFWVAKTINENPNASLIYSDEDKIDSNGVRSDPYFKCEWNYSLFLSHNMISHLGVYKSEIINKIGGFRATYEGSQDYDLALRFIEHISDDNIIHIPRVLYHWRIHNESTASGSDKKPYAVVSGQRAINEHLNRVNVSADTKILPTYMYRVQYKITKAPPLVSIIIPTKDNLKLLKNCINSISHKTKYINYEIIIVNNNSTNKQTLEYLSKIKQNANIFVLEDNNNFNFSAINNKAVRSTKGDYICFLNDDTEVISQEWLTEMVSIGTQKNVGVVGAKLWYPNNTLQHGGVIIGLGGVAGHSHKGIPKGHNGYFNRVNLLQEFSAVTAACMLMPKKVFYEVGGFNEKDLAIAFNDVDLCLRVRKKGYRIVWTPYAELYHYESISRGDDTSHDKIERFLREINYMKEKWGEWIENDPAYSPNLTLNKADFSFAWPPRLEPLD